MPTAIEIEQIPHLEVPPRTLASWLRELGRDRYWLVDGDPFLAGAIMGPRTAENIARILDQVQVPLLVLDAREGATSRGQVATLADLDAVVRSHGENLGPATLDDSEASRNRFLHLSWKPNRKFWRLNEDLAATRLFGPAMDSSGVAD